MDFNGNIEWILKLNQLTLFKPLEVIITRAITE